MYEGTDLNKIYDVLWEFKKNLEIINILNEKYKNLNENPDLEQHFYSRTLTGIYKIGHDSVRLVEWLADYDRCYYENIR